MALEADYLEALGLLGRVCEEYRRETGSPAYLVGGAAVALWTGGAFHSADFDLIVAAEERFHEILLQHGFCPEDRAGKLRVGYYHPDYPQFGWQLVTGPMFDGRADRMRVAQFQINAGSAVVLPAIEDLIADRLGQYAGGKPPDVSRLNQARVLFEMADRIDSAYLRKRVEEEGGDISLLNGLNSELEP